RRRRGCRRRFHVQSDASNNARIPNVPSAVRSEAIAQLLPLGPSPPAPLLAPEAPPVAEVPDPPLPVTPPLATLPPLPWVPPLALRVPPVATAPPAPVEPP